MAKREYDEEPDQAGTVRQKLSPRTVAIGIVLGAVIGAIAVFVTGSILHARDREALAAWEADSLPLIQRAEQIHAAMPAVERGIARLSDASGSRGEQLADRVQGFRVELQRIQRTLDEERLPEILVNVGAASYSGVSRSIEAVTLLERELRAVPVSAAERRPFRNSWSRAGNRFGLGKQLLVRIRCRARVEACATIRFAPQRVA